MLLTNCDTECEQNEEIVGGEVGPKVSKGTKRTPNRDSRQHPHFVDEQ